MKALRRFARRWFILLAAVALVALALPALALAQAAGDQIPDAENLAAWAAITGVILPWVAAFFLQATWSSATKAVAVAVLCVADAVVVTGFTHGWHFDQHLLVTAAAVFALARTTYAGLWSQFGKSNPEGPSIKRLEKATSIA